MTTKLAQLENIKPGPAELLREVLEGLNAEQKRLPSKLFYDNYGSKLFEQICELDEYYLTRTEISVMEESVGEIAGCLGAECLLIELGSGSSYKIRLLLDHIDHPRGYIPIDISKEHLLESTRALAVDYPELEIVPLYADYTKTFSLPKQARHVTNKVFYYPGSTIGNFDPHEAREFLRRIGKIGDRQSGLLIGVDLQKEKQVLNDAYNDNKGVTAEFNLNILRNVNRELHTDFVVDNWEHLAFYNAEEGRIEMHLKSKLAQEVTIRGQRIKIEAGETVLTEYSYKYTPEGFKQLVDGIYEVERVWTDSDEMFSIQFLRAL